jgi:hypothetical protein
MKTFHKLLIGAVLTAGALWTSPAAAQVAVEVGPIEVSSGQVQVEEVAWRPYRGWRGGYYYGGYYRPYRSYYYSPNYYSGYRYYGGYRPYWSGGYSAYYSPGFYYYR